MLSVVIPVDLRRRASELLTRLEMMLDECASAGIQVVVGHIDRGTRNDAKLRKLITARGANIASLSAFKTEPCNLARARNAAAERASGDILLLADVDIYPDIALFNHLATSARSTVFSMAPCAYLTASGTKKLLATKTSTPQALFERTNRQVQHFAIPSSVIAIQKPEYFAAGGFYEGFENHGYEDFDFMLRIATRQRRILLDHSLLVDESYATPMTSTGFRAELGTLCWSNLIHGNIAQHLHHPKNPLDPYYKSRSSNSLIFRERTEALLASLPHGDEMRDMTHHHQSLWDRFCSFCIENNSRPEKYRILLQPSLSMRSTGERRIAIARKIFYRALRSVRAIYSS